MENNKKTFRGILAQSLRLLQKHFIFFSVASVLFFISILLLDFAAKAMTEPFYREANAEGFILERVVYLFNALCALAFFLYYLCFMLVAIHKHAQGKNVRLIGLLRLSTKLFPVFFLVNVLFFLRVAIGLVLLIVPGIFAAVKYSFAGVAVLIDGHNIRGAFRHSKAVVSLSALQYIDYSLIFLVLFGLSFCMNIIIETFSATMLQMRFDLVAQMLDFIEIFIVITAWNFSLVYFFYMYNEFKGRLTKGEIYG